MGYTTDFSGHFDLSRPLTSEEANYIRKFNDTRRMKRDVKKLMELYKGKGGLPLKVVITPDMEEHINFFKEKGLHVELTCITDKRTPNEIYGYQGEFFVGGKGVAGQDNDASVLDHNSPSPNQPGLWCQWTVDKSNTKLEWDGGEKFYSYTEWLQYLIDNFFKPWGVEVNGEVSWSGEDSGDLGKIVVSDNVVTALKAKISY